MSLGGDFYFVATAPGRVMSASMQRGDVGGALNAVHYDNLAHAFHQAVDRVRVRAGVSPGVVVALLPEAEMHAAAVATAESHQRAVNVWNEHQSSFSAVLGRLVGAVVEVHLGIQGLGIGDAFGAVTNSLVQDVRLKEPLTDLHNALNGYDQWLRWCVTILDGDAALNAAHTRTTWRRRIVRAVLVLGVVALGWVGVHRWVLAPSMETASSASAATAMAPSPLAQLEGSWTDEKGAVFDATRVGEAVMFHVHDARQFPRHGMRDGDTRLVLSAVPNDTTVFAVEDHVQPVPPVGIDYDVKAPAASCREVWTEVGGQPLRARYDGRTLAVEVVKLDANWSLFNVAGGKIAGCKALATVKSARMEMVLTRESSP